MQFFGGANLVDTLEISQLFWVEDIFVSQKIYAIVYDCSFIAGIYKIRKLWMSFINIKEY